MEGNATNDIDASSNVSGLDGSVTITTPDLNPLQGATELPRNPITTEATAADACAATNPEGKPSGLRIDGKGGVPPAPDLPLGSEALNIGGKIVAGNQNQNDSSRITVNTPQTIPTDNGEIIPARGVEITADGKIILTAHPTNNDVSRTPTKQANCSG